VAADPYEGGKQAVAEAYRNLSAVGATPIAITDNLNFGNPERPDTMGVIVKAIEGMAEACRALEFPVVSGNVSLYNETDGVGIPPTPVVGGIGLIENLDHVATLKGAQQGDELFTLGATDRHLGASVYARVILGLDGPAAGSPPRVDLSTATIAGRQTLVAVGLAGRSHFSASITPHPTRPDTFLFEIAARIHDRDAGLGSTYATAPAPAAPVRITPPADGPAGLPRTVQWVYTIGPDGIVAGRG
jgi:hypothetical protein